MSNLSRGRLGLDLFMSGYRSVYARPSCFQYGGRIESLSHEKGRICFRGVSTFGPGEEEEN